MNIPDILSPTSIEEIRLPSGEVVPIPKAAPVFTTWTGEPISSTYGGKTILDFRGKPAFAELAILRAFREAGWQGVWVDTFAGQYRTEFWPKNEVALPVEQERFLQDIFDLAGSIKGCWDVFCWREAEVIFAESKRQAHDSIRDSQRRWLHAALQYGLPITSFLVVEWSMEEPASLAVRKREKRNEYI